MFYSHVTIQEQEDAVQPTEQPTEQSTEQPTEQPTESETAEIVPDGDEPEDGRPITMQQRHVWNKQLSAPQDSGFRIPTDVADAYNRSCIYNFSYICNNVLFLVCFIHM